MDLKELYVVKQKKCILDYLSSFLIVNFEQISHILPVFLKVTFNWKKKKMFLRYLDFLFWMNP